MLSTQQHSSAIASLRSQLTAGRITDLTDFWRGAESLNTPLMTPVEEAGDEQEMAFLWRARCLLQGAYLRLDRVTDGEHVKKGMMSVLPETGIQTLTLRLPVSYCDSYSLLKIPPDTTAETIILSGGRFAIFAGKADLLNKMPGISVRGNTKKSVLIFDRTPALSGWDSGFHAERLLTPIRIIAGKPCQVQLYIPDIDIFQSLGLIALSDGETRFDHLGVCTATGAAINNRCIVPVAILDIDNTNKHERTEILDERSKLIEDIVRHLLPIVHAEQPQHQWADRSRIALAGQSLGGVSALIGARYAPETFGLALSHSPSTRWASERTNQSGLFNKTDTSWVSEHLLSALPRGVRISLCVGSLEGPTTPYVRQPHQRLITTNVENHCTVYTDGHDYAWWCGVLVDRAGLLQS